MNRMQPFHIQEVMDMLAEMQQESPVFTKVHEANEDHVETNLRQLIFNPNGISIIAGGHNRDIAGIMLGVVSSSWYSPTREAVEMVLYIRPEYRGGPLAVRMIRRFEAEAIKLGAKIIYAGSSANINDDGVLRLYQRLGFTRTATGVRKIV